MFLLITTYLRPLAEIEPLMPSHLAWLDQHYQTGLFLLSGRKTPRTGGVILARAGGRAALEAVVAQDPFTQAGVVAYDMVEFAPTRAAAGFANLLG